MSESSTPIERPARILIVDDERMNRDVLEVMLTAEGFVIATAASGEEALTSVTDAKPDLILLDVLMPGMGGYLAARKLKSDPATRNIPIIMVTALGDQNAKLFGLSAGAEDFLTKPVERSELRMRVRNLLRLKSHSDNALSRRDDSMGRVSHDLRNLLNGIVLSASLVSDDASDTEEGRRTLIGMARIQSYTTRMNRLIGDLVDVVSMDAGTLSLQLDRYDAVAVIGEAIAAGAHLAAKNGITLASEGLDAALLGRFDRDRMLQVLANLITNALKFTTAGGRVTVRGKRVGDELQLSVTDTGVGIPPTMIDAVFERFLQVRKGDQRGLGLGLYISKCIVESHGGRIWVESVLGEGSTFRVSLPGALPLKSAFSP